MQWDNVVTATIALLQNDPVLNVLLGGPRIYRNRSLPTIQTPGVFYTVISNTVEENYEPVAIQWDIFCDDMVSVASVERRLFELMHHDLPVEIYGLRMWSQFSTGYDYLDSDETIAHRAVEYSYTPARDSVQ